MNLDEYRQSVCAPPEGNPQSLWDEVYKARTARYVARKSIKDRAVDLKGGCCQKCGYNKCLRALEFHHIRPQSKSFNISAVTWKTEVDDLAVTWLRVKQELEKCILLCANCHREVEEQKDDETAAWMNRVLNTSGNMVGTPITDFVAQQALKGTLERKAGDS